MSVTPRRLLACGTAALVLGAAAAPALAATSTTPHHTPAAQDILTRSPKPFEAGCGTTSASERTTRAALLGNAKAWNHIADLVAHAHAGPYQQKGRTTWVSGARTLASSDREYADGDKLLLQGHKTAGDEKCNDAYAPMMRGDVLIVHGERQMGIARFEPTNS